jgi:hypothetical protein
MIANTSAIALAPAKHAPSANTAPIQQRRDLLATLAAFIERVAESPRAADDSERYWTTVARGL